MHKIVLLSVQSFPCARQHGVNDVSFFQGCFNKIQGLLGKIQGLFKDLNKIFNFQGLFKGLMIFRGLFKACANYERFCSFRKWRNSVRGAVHFKKLNQLKVQTTTKNPSQVRFPFNLSGSSQACAVLFLFKPFYLNPVNRVYSTP